jgi:predicted CoA-substrate-specific enzyme activase
VLDANKTLIGHAVKKSGTDFGATADTCLSIALDMAGAGKQKRFAAISTGYGRRNVTYAAQDNKVIKLDDKGLRTGFKMNRKCAAGTGAFFEEMAMRLDIGLEQMDDLARQSENMVKLGSFCTVFSATEVLENIRSGKKLPDIVKGVFFSMIKRVLERVLEMDSLTEKVVMTGGVVAHNLFLVKMTEEIIGRKILIPEYPQLTGAIGAALYAMEANQ